MATQDMGMTELRAEEGVDMLLAQLDTGLPEAVLKSAPHACDKLCEETKLRSTMATFLMEFDVAPGELKEADPESAV